MRGKRVSIIGAGAVGSTVAYSLALQGFVHEIILLDSKTDVAWGKALDMSQAAAVIRQHTIVRVASGYDDLADSDIVIIAAGAARKPGMSRDDLLLINAETVRSISKQIKGICANSFVIVITNPLDAMTYVALNETGFDRRRVIGMAGLLDSGRMASFIYEKLGYGSGQIRATVLGGHGDNMVPLHRYSTVAGVPITDLLSQDEIDLIVKRTKNAGAEIVGYLQSGSAYYAPAIATTMMCEAILRDSKQIYPCAVRLDGEYGYNDVVTGAPIVLGANGVEKIIEVTLNDEEKAEFERSVASVKKLVDTLKEKKFYE
ncbi:MAG: malate dehydrogenase [Helicobacteraceae bacterium]|jgi:malate dehydrogenase|nr:malate dehydrogenase [Helicobacteraceae bacterium]